MSRAPKGERRALDAYYTPPALARACLATLAADIAGARVLEPSCGGGAFVAAARSLGPATVLGYDINADAPGLALCDEAVAGDFLELPERCVDVVVGNPPYRGAEDHIERAIGMAPVVGMLVRMMLLASQKRAGFWDTNPPAEVWVIRERPSFTGRGMDACDYMWCVWRADHVGPPVMGWLSWR